MDGVSKNKQNIKTTLTKKEKKSQRSLQIQKMKKEDRKQYVHSVHMLFN